MSGFFQNLLKDSVPGIKKELRGARDAFFGNEYLRDYTHAAKTFIPNSYQYSPKLKFLFHVHFDINTQNAYAVNTSSNFNPSLAVKTVRLPQYSIDTAVMNQYNRKRIVQTKIKYDPIDIVFHDDNGSMISTMWYNYYTYYYKDATQAELAIAGRPKGANAQDPSSSDYWIRTQYSPDITNNDWGYIGETSKTPGSPINVATGQTKQPFFKNITVYGFNQKNFIAYVLVNPIITKFSHDTYSYAEGGGIMENTMTIDYETVKYFTGAVDGSKPSDIISSFANEANYDRTVSPIARLGANATILGQGGLVDAAGGFIDDLQNGNILGAIQKAGRVNNTFKNTNVSQVAKTEINGVLRNTALIAAGGAVLGAANAARSAFSFPVANSSPGPNGLAGAESQGATSPTTPQPPAGSPIPQSPQPPTLG